MSATAPRRSGLSPRLAVGLLLAAAIAWGGVLFWQSHNSPAWHHIQTGYERARQGDALGAVQEWHTATQLDPNNVYAWQLLGQSYFSVQKWGKAQEAYQQLRRIDPNWPQVNSLLARCALNLGDADTALACAQEELKRHPDDAPSLEVCAKVQGVRGDLKDQIETLRHLTRLQPTNAAHLSELVQALLAQREMTEAHAVADQLVQVAPNSAEAYRARGLAGFYAESTPQGLTQVESDLLHALSLDPKCYPCHLFLARVYKRTDRWKDAAVHLEAATRLDPKNPDAYLDLADVYTHTGKAASATALRQKYRVLVQAAEQSASQATHSGGM